MTLKGEKLECNGRFHQVHLQKGNWHAKGMNKNITWLEVQPWHMEMKTNCTTLPAAATHFN